MAKEHTPVAQMIQQLGDEAEIGAYPRSEAHAEVMQERQKTRSQRQDQAQVRHFNNGSVVQNPTRKGKVGAIY